MRQVLHTFSGKLPSPQFVRMEGLKCYTNVVTVVANKI